MQYASGSVARSSSGKGWRAVLRWKDSDGVWRNTTRSLKGAKTKREARAMLKDLMESAPEPPKSPIPLYAYSAAYIERKSALKAIQPATATDYRKSINGWKPYLEDMALSEVTPRAIEDALTAMLEDASAQTVLKRYVALKMVLEHAVKTHELAENPMEHVPRPRPMPSTPNALLGEDLQRLKERLPSLPMKPWVVGVALCLYAGLRAEEACGLQPADIDLDGRVGWVRRAIGYARGGDYVAPPKNRKPRDFPICRPLAEMLERWMQVRPDSPWLLSTDGSMPTVRQIGSKWSMLCEVEDYRGQDGRKPTLHDLRHTFATQCVKAGMDIKTLQSILGHSSAAITLDVYASADAGAKQAASSIIERAI